MQNVQTLVDRYILARTIADVRQEQLERAAQAAADAEQLAISARRALRAVCRDRDAWFALEDGRMLAVLTDGTMSILANGSDSAAADVAPFIEADADAGRIEVAA